MRFAAVFLSFALAFSGTVITPSPTPKPTTQRVRITEGKPLVLGHNGGAGITPEDTIVGIQKTAAAGATMLDIDIQFTANNNTQGNPGYAVMMHDDTVDRTTNGTGTVKTLGLTYITGLLAQDYAPFKTDSEYATTKVPYAWDFFNASKVNSITLELDVKVVPTEWAAKKLMEYADRFVGGRDRMIFASDGPSITAMRQWFPDLTYTYLEYPPTGVMRTAEYLQSIGVTTYSIPQKNITTALVSYYHSYGIKVGTWTTDNINGVPQDNAVSWQALTDLGVDTITTNKVAEYLAWQPN